MIRLPLMSYKTHELSSCPLTSNRPEGSTQTPATGDPKLEFVLVTGVTTFTQPLVRKSQNRTVLSWNLITLLNKLSKEQQLINFLPVILIQK